MDTLYFEQKLEAVDFSVIDEISALEPTAAFPIIEKGLTHPNEDVRELSVLALEKRPEDKAVELLMKSIVDKDMSVQIAALHAMAKRPSIKMVAGLKQALPQVDSDVRGEIVLLLGMCGDASQIEYLRVLLMKAEKEGERELSHDINLALARLGDVAAQKSLLINLNSEQVEDRRDALQDFEYINDPRLVAELKPLLNDTDVAMDIGKGPQHVYLRICDLAVMSVNKVLGHPFSFAERGRQFTKEERQGVALYIERNYGKNKEGT